MRFHKRILLSFLFPLTFQNKRLLKPQNLELAKEFRLSHISINTSLIVMLHYFGAVR